MTTAIATRKLENIEAYVEVSMKNFDDAIEEAHGLGWFDSFALEKIVKVQAIASLAASIKNVLNQPRDWDITDEEKVEEVRTVVLNMLIQQTAFQSSSIMQNARDLEVIRTAQKFLDNLTWW
jgi:hypothetical protein